MPLKTKDGGEIYFVAELLYNQLDERIRELESVDAYAQILVEIDAYLDASLLDLLVEVNRPELAIFIEELWNERILTGRRIAELLRKKGVLKTGFVTRLAKFKSGRNKVVHEKHHIFALIKEDENSLEDLGRPVVGILGHVNAREEIARKEFAELKKKGKKLLEEIIQILKKVYADNEKKKLKRRRVKWLWRRTKD